MAETRFFHGTSRGSGLESGDWIDPSKSSYESCIWGTSSLEIAGYWASSKDALDDSGAVIFEICLATDRVLTISECDLGDTGEVLTEAIKSGYEAVIFEDGEDCVPTIAILTGRAATVREHS